MAAVDTSTQVVIEPMTAEDWDEVRVIYADGLATGDATFETEVPAWTTWDASHLAAARLVARGGGRVVGWAALSPVSERCVYGGVAETSVYVAAVARGRRVGTGLLLRLVAESEAAGLWTLQAGVFPENTASLAVHETCGFRRVGVRRRLGRIGERWRDVVLLERRSDRVGADVTKGDAQ